MATESFPPIAIVGRSCILPHALSPEALWDVVSTKKDCISDVPNDRWGVRPETVSGTLDKSVDASYSTAGGYVRDFESLFNPADYGQDGELLAQLDPLFQWVAYTSRQALIDSGHGETLAGSDTKCGLVLGNLSFPTHGMARFGASCYLQQQNSPLAGHALLEKVGLANTQPLDRYMSGLPAQLTSRILGLSAGAFCLDAACASSLYAIKLAANRLHNHEADLMLAGAVNRSDNLFLHVGFCALSALSGRGQSRPFHQGADGLVPGEGAGVIAMMRLEDAIASGRQIHGVIRGVGLSNDGRARNLLAPATDGQIRAMKSAYRQSGIDPSTLSMVECHATGTPMGDRVELESMQQVFAESQPNSVNVGSLKSNMGHLVTGAGVAGLIKVLESLKHETMPATRHTDAPIGPLKEDNSPFNLLTENKAWERSADHPRRAAVSAFGFGGNNAHLVLEEYEGKRPDNVSLAPIPASVEDLQIAVVGLGARVGGGVSLSDLAHHLFQEDTTDISLKQTDSLTLDVKGVRFPPNDLKTALPQQLQIFESIREAVRDLPEDVLSKERTSVLVGMQCDSDVTTPGIRWCMRDWASAFSDDALSGAELDKWVDEARTSVAPPVNAQGVLGQMPNIPANRLNVQLNLGGPGFTISSEELSGIDALHTAIGMLTRSEIDTAIVGAVDMSRDFRDEIALKSVQNASSVGTGDAACSLVLMRASEAAKRNLPVYGYIKKCNLRSSVSESRPPMALGNSGSLKLFSPRVGQVEDTPAHFHTFSGRFGHAHSAVGLLHVLGGLLCMHERRVPNETTHQPSNGVGVDYSSCEVVVESLGHGVGQLLLSRAPDDAVFAARLNQETPKATIPLTCDGHRTFGKLPHFPSNLVPRAETKTPVATESIPMTSSGNSNKGFGQHMPQAPNLVAISNPDASTFQPNTTTDAQLSMGHGLPLGSAAPSVNPPVATAPAATPAQPLSQPMVIQPQDQSGWGALSLARQRLGHAHQAFIEQQHQIHLQFLQMRQNANQQLHQAVTQGVAPMATTAPAFESGAATATPAAPHMFSQAVVSPAPSIPQAAQAPLAAPAPTLPPVTHETKPASPAVKPVAPAPAQKKSNDKKMSPIRFEMPGPVAEGPYPGPETRENPLWDRKDLESLASDKISAVLGPLFERQDGFKRQVRMPEPPLLLCDRVLSIDAEPGVLKPHTSIYTESDVTYDKWYTYNGRITPGVLIESGQADLLLISYMGVDFENAGERVYRLLGCDLMYGESLPRVGSTLFYDIHIDGFAKTGNTRIFFFHSDCRIGGPDGPVVLSVRNGQAGFFTDEELRDSGGILWSPEDEDAADITGPLEKPRVQLEKTSFSREDLEKLASGDVYGCFGSGFEIAQTHVRTPTIQSGDMLLMDRVTQFDPKGGPWGRGYLRAELDLTGDNWFFDGHFKDDPCMPGTIMFEGCLQCLDFYMIGMGMTLDKDGFRFEPGKKKVFPLRCRGQAIPSSRHMVYEVFVKEIRGGHEPSIMADILVTVDGLKGLHCEEVEVDLVVDWPMDSYPELLGHHPKESGWDAVGGVLPAGTPADPNVHFDQTSLLATGLGRPSEAFGELYAPYDAKGRVPRLPGPPYHFMSRVTEIDGPGSGAFKPGTTVAVEYDVPPDAWYFSENPWPAMPFAVLLEVALQPCGWLSSFTGSIRQTEEELYYRNLDGNAKLHCDVYPDVGTVTTRTTLKKISSSGGMIIQEFDFAVTAGDQMIFEGSTVFGFFPSAALARQVGTGSSDEEKAQLKAPCPALSDGTSFPLDLRTRPERYTSGSLRLPEPMLLMIDEITGFWPEGGKAGKGRVRTLKYVDLSEWFFKAHFFQDPVQPGSLGIEAMIQAIQWWMLHHDMGKGFTKPRFEPLATQEDLSWKYRGQVIPKNKHIEVEIEILEVNDNTVVAEGWLWVDGLRIYQAPRLAVRVVEEPRG